MCVCDQGYRIDNTDGLRCVPYETLVSPIECGHVKDCSRLTMSTCETAIGKQNSHSPQCT